MHNLKFGSRGYLVKLVQLFLKNSNIPVGPIDGIFGPKVRGAVEKFQSSEGLSVTGRVDGVFYRAALADGMVTVRPVSNAELTPELISFAKKSLRIFIRSSAAYYTSLTTVYNGVTIHAVAEQHYHTPGGPRKPWGPHLGVTLYAQVSEQVPDVPAGSDAVIPAVTTIVLDPGHGGHDPVGGSSPNNARGARHLEKDMALNYCEHIKAHLERLGGESVEVIMTRQEDVNLGLYERASVAKDCEADVFLSVHFNGFDRSVRGTEVLIRSMDGGNLNYVEDHKFASAVLEGTLSGFPGGGVSRKVKSGRYGVLNDFYLPTSCVSALLEVEFLDVPSVEDTLEEHVCEITGGIAQGILRYAL